MVVMGGLALAVVGCVSPGQTIPLAATAASVPPPEKLRSPLRVAVVPFEDIRADKASIGRYQHYIESVVDRLVPVQDSAGDQVTAFVVDYLKLAGFEVSRAPSAEAVAPGSADVVLTGQIEAYWTEAVARFARTELKATNRLVIKLANAADSSKVRATIGGEGTSTVVFFDLADLEQLNSESLGQSLARFLADVTVVNQSLKPKG
jgi:Holliday junction resolvase